MWGLSSRAPRLIERKRFVRAVRVGVARVVVRGSVEHATVEIQGELDFTCAEDVMRAVLGLPHSVAAIDLSMLDFIDSAGVRKLRKLIDVLAQRRGEHIHVHGVSETIRRTFALVPTAGGSPLTTA